MRKLKVTLWTGSLATRRKIDWWTSNLPYTLTCTSVRWEHLWPIRQGTTPRIHSSPSETVFLLVGQGWRWEEELRGEWAQGQFQSPDRTPAFIFLVLLGLIQAVGGFVVYFTVYAQEGFKPSILINLRVEWEDSNVNDLEDSYGQQWVREGDSAFSISAWLCHFCPISALLSLLCPDWYRTFTPWTALMREDVKVFSVNRAVCPFVT